MEKLKISNEELVMKDLQVIGALKKFPDLKVRDIGKGIVIVEREGNIKAYYLVNKGKFEFLFNITSIRDLFKSNIVKKTVGVKEIQENGVYNMYSLVDIDYNNKPKKGTKPIDKYSHKYLQIWNDIAFYEIKIFLEQSKNLSTEGDYHKISEGELKGIIESRSLRIRDLHTFLKQGQIDKPLFEKYLPTLQKLLLTQIGDTRFDNVGDPVTEKEIKEYLKEGLISKKLATECYYKLKEIEKAKSNKQKQKTQIHSEAHYGVENEVMVG